MHSFEFKTVLEKACDEIGGALQYNLYEYKHSLKSIITFVYIIYIEFCVAISCKLMTV